MKPENSHLVNFFYDHKLFSPPNQKDRPAFFLDRDGVIIKDINYIKNPDDVQLEKGAKDFIRNSYNKNIPIIIITNQSGIYRRFFSWDDYIRVNDRIIELLGEPNPITAIYANGLGPNAPNYSWRKPSPEMIKNAANYLKINIKESILVGDRLSDLESGLNAGIKKNFHVSTGHGKVEKKSIVNFMNNNKKYNLENNIFFIENLDKLNEKLISNLIFTKN